MKKIDRNNYETFFIDFLDGNLPLDEIDLLLDFLNENPDLAGELKNLEKIKLQPSSFSDFSFQHLKKSDLDLPEVFEETCIRAIENDLTPNEYRVFQEYVSHNKEHRNSFELFKLTISEPDPFIVYDKKISLKKTGKTIGFRYWYAVAAIVILGMMFFLPSDQETRKQSAIQVAKSDEIKVTKPNKGSIEKSIETKVPVSTEVKKKIKNYTTASSAEKHSFIAKGEMTKETQTEETRRREIIEPMNPLFSEVQIDRVVNNDTPLALVERRVVEPKKDYSKYLTIKELIAQKINGTENKGSVEKAALNTLKKVSGEKFDYSTTTNGKVKKLEFNSPLIAFSIPLNSKN